MNEKQKKQLWIFNAIFAVVLILYIVSQLFISSFKASNPTLFTSDSDAEIRYIALGDSYSIGEGARKDEAWPAVLAENLNRGGVSIELVSNPSKTGFTTQDLIDKELPFVYSTNVNFASVQIGVNDWVQGVSADDFRENFKFILEEVSGKMGAQNVFVVTIPDFSITPSAQRYANGRDISSGIAEFNQIIIEESEKEGILVVDIFDLSQNMTLGMFARDGIHPNKFGYNYWEDYIFEEVKPLLDR